MKPRRLFSAARLSFPLASALVALSCSLLAPKAQAELWVPTAAGTTYDWGTTTNWNPATFPNSTTAVASINNNILGAQTILLNASRTVNDLNLGDSDGSHGFTIATGTAGSLLIFGGTAPTMDVTGIAANTISAAIRADANVVFRSTSTAETTISTAMTAAAVRNITFNNDIDGTVTGAATNQGQFGLTAANTLGGATGTVTINDVRVRGNITGAFGANAANSVTVAGAGQMYVPAGTHVNNVVLNSTGWVENAGNLGSLRVEGGGIVNGTVTMQQHSILSSYSGTGTIGGVISGALFNLTKTGPGSLTLSNAANTYTGTTTIAEGTLSVGNVVVAANASGLGGATSAVILGGAGTQGILNYTGAAATMTRPFTINAGGGRINSTANALTLTPASGTIIAASGPVTFGGANNINVGSTAYATTLMTGATAINKVDGGTLTFNVKTDTGVITKTDTTPINVTAGTMAVTQTTAGASSNILGLGTITITQGAALTFSSGGGASVFTLPNPIVMAAAAGTANISGNVGALTSTGAISFAAGSTSTTILKLNNNNGTAGGSIYSGAITGTGTIQLNPSGGGSPITLSGAQNQTGVISNNGSSTSTATLSGAIGTGISGISQAGANPFTVSASVPLSAGLKTFTSTGAGAFNFTNANTFSGTQDLTFNANSTGGITVSGTNLNHTGKVTNSGTGSGTTTISSAIGANITGISQAGINPFTVSASVPLSAGLNTFTSTGTGAFNFTNANTFSGTQNLTFNANSTGGITVSGTNLNHTGSITNSGTNVGSTTISSAIGSSVTNIIQNSATSPLVLSGSNSAYTGTHTITNGVMQFSNVVALANYSSAPAAVKISVGSNGILGFAYGSENQWAASELTALLNGAGSTYPNVSFAATGVSISLDTTTASTSFASVLANPAGTTSFGLVKRGTNTLTLGNANTYSGATWIQNGTLSAGILNSVTTPVPVGASSLGVPSSIPNGTISLGTGTTTGVLSYTGAGETTDRVINLAGTTGGATIDQSGTGPLHFTGNMTFAGTGTKTLTLSGSTAGTGEISGTIAGSFSNTGTASTTPFTINKTGTGTWTLSGTGNTAAAVTISGGILDTGVDGLTLGNVGAITIAASANATINGKIILAGVGAAGNGADVGATTAGVTLTLNAIIAGGDTNNVDFWSAPTGVTILTGANTWSGQTSLGGQTVQVSSINSVATNGGLGTVHSATSNLGSPTTVATGTILLANSAAATLRYVGTGETTDRVISLNAAQAGAIDQSGTGLLKFTSAFTAGANAKTLTLQGSTAGSGEIAGAIVQNSVTNFTALTKAGTGTWTLSGNNTYTGATTVNGGNLRLTTGGTTDNSAVTVNNGGTLSIVGNYTIGNAVTAAAGGRLTLATGGTLDLADGAINDLTLTQSGTFATAGAAFNGGTIKLDVSGTDADSIINSGGTVGSTSSGSNSIVINPIAGFAAGGADKIIIRGGAGTSTINASNLFLATSTVSYEGSPYTLSLSQAGKDVLLTIAAGAGSAPAPGLAYWNGTTNSSWAHQPGGAGNATNWVAAASGGPDTLSLPDSTSNIVMTSNTVGTGGLTTTIDSVSAVNSLNFAGTGSSNTVGSIINAGSGTNLTINAAAINGNALGNGITVAAGSGANLINVPVVLGASQTWTNNSTNPLTVTGGITGTGFTLTTAGTGAIQIGNGGTSGSIATNVALVSNGVLAFNRSDTVNQGTDFATAISGTGGVAQNGAGTLVLSGTNTYTGNTTVNGGILNITGSITGNGTTTTGSILNVGTVAGQNAVVNVNGGNINTYYSFGLGTVANSVGVLNLSNGSYTGTSTQTNNTINFVGQAGYGYLNITGGTFAAKGRFAPSNGVGTTGVMYIGGTGTFDHTAGEWFLMAYSAAGTGGLSQVTVGPGGNLNRVGASNLFGLNMDRANGYAVLSMAGGQMDNGIRAISFGNGGSATTNTTGILNLAGGTLTVGVAMANNPGTGTGNTGYLNFAGGTLRTSAAVTAIIPASSAGQSITSTIHGPINNSAVSGAPSFVGGLTVDTNTFNSTLTNALLAPVGMGVRQADLTLSGGAGYVGAPAVQFSKPAVGGSPASGYALISDGAVTGIVITSPGDYAAGEVPTVTLTGGGASSPATVTVAALNTAATSGGLTKSGVGQITLSGGNTFSGAVNITGGTLMVPTINNGGSASGTLGVSSSAASNLLLNSATAGGGILGYNGTVAGTTDRNFTLANVSGGFDASGTTLGTFTLTAANAMTVAPSLGAATLTLQGTGAGATGLGSIGTLLADGTGTTVGVNKAGSGTWAITNLANSYTGPTTLTAGTLSVPKLSPGGSNSSIGTSTSAAANLVFQGGTLQYTGPGDTTDRNYTFGNATNAAGGGIDSAGTGPLVISGSMTPVNTAVNTQVLTLTANVASGNNSINGIVDSNTGTSILTGVTKSGPGTWIVGGTNTYTGVTTISNGTLQFAGGSALNGATPIGMANGATLQLRDDTAGTISHTANNITATASGTVTIDVGNNGGANTGSTVAFGALNSGIGTNALAVTYNFTGANGYLQRFSSVALPGSTGNNTTFNPTTSSVVVTGAVTSQMASFTNANFNTLFLNGTSSGNAINGVISDAVGASPTLNGLTRITKQNTSTWTLAGVSTYRGITTIDGGTLKLAAGSGLANTAITVNPATTGGNPTFVVTPGSGIINIGSTGVTGLGATLTLNPGTAAKPFAPAFTMQDDAVGTVNLNQQATFAVNALTLGGPIAVDYIRPSLSFDIGGTAVTVIDVINVSKSATVGSGGVTLNFAALSGTTSLTPGDYTFLTASGGLSVGGAGYTLGTPTISLGATTYALSLANSTATAGILTVAALSGNDAAFWQGDIGGSWNSPFPATDTNFATSLDGSTDTGALPDFESNVTFSTTAASNLSTTLDANFTINSLSFNGTGTSNAAGSTIASGTGFNTLTINASALNGNLAGNGISVGIGSGPNVISAPVALGASQSWTVASGTSLAVSGDVSGSGPLKLPGAGTVTLSGNNSYSGGTSLNAGKLVINSATAIGTEPLTVINAMIDSTAVFAGQLLTTNNTQTWVDNGALAFTGTQSLNLGTGAVTLGTAAAANFTLSNSAAPATSILTVGGAITGGAGGTAAAKTLTVAGTGDIVLSGDITKGATATALDLTVTNTGNVSLAGASTIRTLNANGGPTSVINLTAGSLTLSNNGGQTINSTGGTINGPGTITLSGSTGGAGDNGVATGATLTINAQMTGNTDFEFWSASQYGTFVLTNVDNSFNNLLFNVNGAVSVPSLGTSGSNGPAGRGAINFAGGGTLIYTGNGEISDKSINLSGTTAGGALDQSGPSGNLVLTTFGTPGAGSKTLTLQGSTAGTGQISAAILDNSAANKTAVTKTGTGLWNLSGANLYTGTTTVNGGILSLSGTSGATPITVNTGGTLQVGTATAVTAINNVTLAGTGTLDLFGNSVSIGSLTSTATNLITNSSANVTASTATTPGTPAGVGVFVDALTITTAGPTAAALITDGPTRKTQIVLNNGNSNTAVTTNTSNTYSGGLVLAHNAAGTRLSPGTINGTPWGTGPIIIGQGTTDRAGLYCSVANQILANPLVFNSILGTDVVGAARVEAATTFTGIQTAGLSAISYGSYSSAGALTVSGRLTGSGTFRGVISNAGGNLGGGTAISTNAGLIVGASINATTTVTLSNPGTNNDYTGDTSVTGRGVLRLGLADQIPNGTGFGNVVVGTGGILDLNAFSDAINGLSGNGTVDGTSGTPTLTLGDNNATGNNFSGIIRNTAGTLAVTKIGNGTQILAGANLYTGATTVNAGTLLVNSPGSLAAGSEVTVNGGTLGGTGTVGGNVTVAAAGNLAPGASAGTLKINGVLNISAQAGGAGTLVYELGAPAGPNDKIEAGNLEIGSGSLGLNDFVFTNIGGVQAGTYTLITSAGGITGSLEAGNLTGVISPGYVGTLKINVNNLELEVKSAYSIWADGTFANGSIPSDKRGLNDDPDNDTLTNLQEYAFGTDPTVITGDMVYVKNGTVTTPGKPIIEVDPTTDKWYAVFCRRADYADAGLTYIPEFSSYLDAWVPNNNTLNPPVKVTTGGTIDAIRVWFPNFIQTPENGPEKPTFFRVGVDMTP